MPDLTPKDDSFADAVFRLFERARDEGRKQSMAILVSLWFSLGDNSTGLMAAALRPYMEWNVDTMAFLIEAVDSEKEGAGS